MISTSEETLLIFVLNLITPRPKFTRTRSPRDEALTYRFLWERSVLRRSRGGLVLCLCWEQAPLEPAASSCCDRHESSDFMRVQLSLARKHGSHWPWERLKSPVCNAFAPSRPGNISCRFCCGPFLSQDAQLRLIHLADLVRFGPQTVCSFLSLFFFRLNSGVLKEISHNACSFFGKIGIRAKSSSWWWGAQETKATAATRC